MIRMSHPDIPDAEPATTTEEAFRTMWEPRGWELADEAVLAAEGILGQPVPSLDGLKKAGLVPALAKRAKIILAGAELAGKFTVSGVAGRHRY